VHASPGLPGIGAGRPLVGMLAPAKIEVAFGKTHLLLFLLPHPALIKIYGNRALWSSAQHAESPEARRKGLQFLVRSFSKNVGIPRGAGSNALFCSAFSHTIALG